MTLLLFLFLVQNFKVQNTNEWHEHSERKSNNRLQHLHLADTLCPKRLKVIHTYIDTLMAVAAMQGANQHIGSNLPFSILPKDT